MIITVTLNPMLDKTVYVPSLKKRKTQRAGRVEMVVGGKGVNVSRQLNRLGSPTIATGFFGGEVGDILERLLTQEGIAHDFVRVEGMTREGVTYREENGHRTAVFEPPHAVSRSEIVHLVRKCRRLAARGGWLVCSGSSPARRTDRVFRVLLEEARRRGAFTVIDSYGEALVHGLKSRPTLVKVNREEYQSTFGVRLDRQGETRHAVRELLSCGARYGVITDGKRPAFGTFQGNLWRVIPPELKTVNPTGSGDSMLAGILYGLTEGWSFRRCLQIGAAAGAANAQQWAVASASRKVVWEIARNVSIQEL
jgi:tagatose 6-phosphate kinase